MHRVRFIVGGLTLLICCQASVAQESQEELLGKAADAAQQRDSKAAVRWATQAIDAGDAPPVAFYLRGRERLRLAEFSQAVDDFDQYIRLKPAIATRMWERGIALRGDEEVFCGSEEPSCLGARNCFAWERGIVLLGNEESFCA